MNKKLLSVLLFLVLALALPACAADWPAKSIRMIVPFAAVTATSSLLFITLCRVSEVSMM